VVKNPSAYAGDTWFNPWVRKIPWRRKWQPTPVFLPGESHGGAWWSTYSPGGLKKRVGHNLATKTKEYYTVHFKMVTVVNFV